MHIKKAAARFHAQVGWLDKKKSRAIVRAADEILEKGLWLDQFVVDVYQAGAGTSHNMNTNEVLANRAIEILGGKRGDYQLVHPNDHVNMGQSTNDVIPTAIRLSGLILVRDLLPVLEKLSKALFKKGGNSIGFTNPAGRTCRTRPRSPSGRNSRPTEKTCGGIPNASTTLRRTWRNWASAGPPWDRD